MIKHKSLSSNSIFPISWSLLIKHKIHKGFKIAIKNKNSVPINEKINADKVLLILNNGEKRGIVSFEEAMKVAEKAKLDLVQVSPSESKVVVCKLIDYGKHIFEKKKNNSSSKTKVKRTSVKEIKFRPSTDVGDYNIKLKKIKTFIENGDKIKISVRFRGREILNSNLGLDLLERVQNDLIDICQIDHNPTLEGKQLLMVLSPVSKKN